MAPRPRKKKSSGLPPNLYTRNGGKSFIFKRPDDGTWHGMGTDKHAAIQAAKQLNSLLMVGQNLISAVMGTGLTVREFIADYKETVLKKKDLSKSSLELFDCGERAINKAFGDTALDNITLKMVGDLLASQTDRRANQIRSNLTDIFAHAVAQGLMAENYAAITIKRIETKRRKRHTVAGLKAIWEKSPLFLQNAIDWCLVTTQRREDIAVMRFDDEKPDGFYVRQIKTEKASDAGYIRFALTPQLKALISRCRDDIPSPYLIHRRPDRLDRKQQKNKLHWTAVEPDYISRAFQEARELANPYPELDPDEQPGFHEVRALALHLYKKAGKKPAMRRKIAGHTTEKQTRNYEADHEDIVWTDAVADLDIEEIFK